MLLAGNDSPRKAYVVPLNGKVTRTFLVYANTAAEARDAMHGDRANCEPIDDQYEEVSVGRPRRYPLEDR